MDPITILLGAKSAYEAIKTGVGVGKEIGAMIGDVSKLFAAVNDLTRIVSEPPRGWGNQVSAEQLALDAFVAKREAEDMQEHVKNMVIGEYGMAGWDEIHREIIRIRKEQKAALIEEARKRDEFVELVLVWISVGLGFCLLLGALVALILALIR